MENKENIETDLSCEDLCYASHDKIDALIDLLIEKKLITEAEFVESLKQLYLKSEEEKEE